ncbi:ATP-binding protein [Streptomyces sp. HSW2009]|uniref:ATP-binding protein n=1 Tax=Streptomyces sp. HSW2009 TaxID=3142890 RepID=UPI0032EC9C43
MNPVSPVPPGLPAPGTPVVAYLCWPHGHPVDVRRALARVHRHLDAHGLRPVALFVERSDLGEYAYRRRWAAARALVESGDARAIVSLWPVMLWWTARQRAELAAWARKHDAHVITVGGSAPTGISHAVPSAPAPRCAGSASFSRVAHVADARRFVAACLSGVGRAEVVEDAVLVTSELVANALEHAMVEPHASVGLSVWCGTAEVHIEVRDISDAPPQRACSTDEFALRGRGLQMVEAVAKRWGYAHLRPGPGKRVWATVELTG